MQGDICAFIQDPTCSENAHTDIYSMRVLELAFLSSLIQPFFFGLPTGSLMPLAA
jgi:hypothetical protein